MIPDLEPKKRPNPWPVSEGTPAPFLRRTVVLIPAFNEAACVAETVHAWLDLGAGRVRVADNGSADDTARVASESGAEVLFEPRRGYGAAARCGLQDWPMDFEWVLFSSADGSDRLSAAETERWQEAVDSGADLVLGDRTSLRSARRHLKLTQRLGNWLCCAVIARGWGRRFSDMASLRLVRRATLDRMQLCDHGFGWNVEMQVRALELGLRTVELPVSYFPRRAGVSKISGSLSGTVRAGYGILKMLAYLWRLRGGRDARLSHALASRPN
jgi:glycosyltransferase involved in cell wall biosynthesis